LKNKILIENMQGLESKLTSVESILLISGRKPGSKPPRGNLPENWAFTFAPSRNIFEGPMKGALFSKHTIKKTSPIARHLANYHPHFFK